MPCKLQKQFFKSVSSVTNVCQGIKSFKKKPYKTQYTHMKIYFQINQWYALSINHQLLFQCTYLQTASNGYKNSFTIYVAFISS